PEVYATDFDVRESIIDLIERGPDPAVWTGRLRPDGLPDRSDACFIVYSALHKAGATPTQIAAICINRDNAISERWHEPKNGGYRMLCRDIHKSLERLG